MRKNNSVKWRENVPLDMKKRKNKQTSMDALHAFTTEIIY